MTPRRRHRRTPPRQLDEAVEGLVIVLAACGYDRRDIDHTMRRALARTPFRKTTRSRINAEFVADAPHVLTLWFQDPALLQSNGRPRPLPLAGTTGSVESLVHRLARPHDAKTMVQYLRRVGGIKAVKGGWIPANRFLLFKDPVGSAVQALEGTLGYLRTSRRNIARRRLAPWFEARLTSQPLPHRSHRRVDRLVRQWGHNYLAAMDRRLAALQDPTAPKSKTVRVGIGTYFYELPD